MTGDWTSLKCQCMILVSNSKETRRVRVTMTKWLDKAKAKDAETHCIYLATVGDSLM